MARATRPEQIGWPIVRLTDDRPTDRYPAPPAPPATVLAATATAMAEWCEDYLPGDAPRPGARRPAVTEWRH